MDIDDLFSAAIEEDDEEDYYFPPPPPQSSSGGASSSHAVRSVALKRRSYSAASTPLIGSQDMFIEDNGIGGWLMPSLAKDTGSAGASRAGVPPAGMPGYPSYSALSTPIERRGSFNTALSPHRGFLGFGANNITLNPPTTNPTAESIPSGRMSALKPPPGFSVFPTDSYPDYSQMRELSSSSSSSHQELHNQPIPLGSKYRRWSLFNGFDLSENSDPSNTRSSPIMAIKQIMDTRDSALSLRRKSTASIRAGSGRSSPALSIVHPHQYKGDDDDEEPKAAPVKSPGFGLSEKLARARRQTISGDGSQNLLHRLLRPDHSRESPPSPQLLASHSFHTTDQSIRSSLLFRRQSIGLPLADVRLSNINVSKANQSFQTKASLSQSGRASALPSATRPMGRLRSDGFFSAFDPESSESADDTLRPGSCPTSSSLVLRRPQSRSFVDKILRRRIPDEVQGSGALSMSPQPERSPEMDVEVVVPLTYSELAQRDRLREPSSGIHGYLDDMNTMLEAFRELEVDRSSRAGSSRRASIASSIGTSVYGHSVISRRGSVSAGQQNALRMLSPGLRPSGTYVGGLGISNSRRGSAVSVGAFSLGLASMEGIDEMPDNVVVEVNEEDLEGDAASVARAVESYERHGDVANFSRTDDEYDVSDKLWWFGIFPSPPTCVYCNGLMLERELRELVSAGGAREASDLACEECRPYVKY